MFGLLFITLGLIIILMVIIVQVTPVFSPSKPTREELNSTRDDEIDLTSDIDDMLNTKNDDLISDMDVVLDTKDDFMVVYNPAGRDWRFRGKHIATYSEGSINLLLYKTIDGKYLLKYFSFSGGEEKPFKDSYGGPDSGAVFSSKKDFESRAFDYLALKHRKQFINLVKQVPEFEHLAYENI